MLETTEVRVCEDCGIGCSDFYVVIIKEPNKALYSVTRCVECHELNERRWVTGLKQDTQSVDDMLGREKPISMFY